MSEETKEFQEEKAEAVENKTAAAESSETKPEKEAPKTELEMADEKIAELNQKIEELTKENADLKDQVLRRAADFDNYRKRMIQEKQDAFDYANTALLKDLLESLDNFDRTVEAAATASDPKSIADGITMINKALVSMLENKYSLTAYGTAGDSFDPDVHEAIGSSNDPVAEPVLKAVYLKGYKLKNRVIRHAKVMVSMPDGSVKAPEGKESDAAEKAE